MGCLWEKFGSGNVSNLVGISLIGMDAGQPTSNSTGKTAGIKEEQELAVEGILTVIYPDIRILAPRKCVFAKTEQCLQI